MRQQVGLQLRLRRKQASNGDHGDCLASGLDAKPPGKVLADALRGRDRNHRMSCSALSDGLAETVFQHEASKAASRRSWRQPTREDRNVAGITTEGGDILLGPFESGDLIEQAEVGGSLAQIQEPIDTETVINRYARDVASEGAALIGRARPEVRNLPS